MTRTDKNTLVAEFMGWEKSLEPTNMYDFPENFNDPLTKEYHCISGTLMRFDTSWDWLMPVIDKLQEVIEEPEDLDVLRDILWWGSIEQVFDSVVDNIIDYNEKQ